jgi:hypothetical protein
MTDRLLSAKHLVYFSEMFNGLNKIDFLKFLSFKTPTYKLLLFLNVR